MTATPKTKTWPVLALLVTTFATRADAQLCPDVQAASDKLVALRVQLNEKNGALTHAEAVGPETLADQDRLTDLRQNRPGQIRSERDRVRNEIKSKQDQIRANRDRRREQLQQKRNETAARNGAQLDAQKARYSALIKDGAPVGGLEQQLRSAEDRHSQLVQEKRRVMDDLRMGKFCSECGRAAYEFEKAGQSFEKHLKDVNGHPVMKPEQIKARSDDFDRQIRDADKRVEELENNLQEARGKHASEVSEALNQLTQLQTETPKTLASLDERIQSEIDGKASELAAADAESDAAEKRYADQETQRATEERVLSGSIERRAQEYAEKVGTLRSAVQDLESRRAPLESAFNAAVAKCRGNVTSTIESSASENNSRRQGIAAARNDFDTASYDQTREQELARRAALDDGREPPVEAPSERLATLEQKISTAAGSARTAVGTARDSWRAGLGLRESAFYRKLPSEVRQKVDANVETFTSGLNTTRAVIRDSLGRVRAGSTLALINNALGRGNGLAADLNAAVQSGKPQPLKTVKNQLMPTIEAIGIEAAVDGREGAAGRTFDAQERVAERGYVRAMTYLLDRKKQGEAMIDTYNETVDTFMRSLDEDENKQ